jgi:predicted ATPase
MIIQSVHVKNFRSILDATLPCSELTAIVGANGAGKSTFLRALALFYDPSLRVDHEDFYDCDVAQEIVIAVTYANLSSEAKEQFEPYLQHDTLTVERVTRYLDGKPITTYHGASLRHEAFDALRAELNASGRAKQAKEAYNSLRSDAQYTALPAWSNLQAGRDALRDWEAAQPAVCSRGRDEGQFFGFKEVGQGYLGRFTRFLFIPAVRDAADDAAEGKGSVLTSLMDMVVRSRLAGNAELKALEEETQRKYDAIVDPTKTPELRGLATELSSTLHTFVPEAAIELKWLPAERVALDLPRADVRLIEDQYETAVHRTGHGLQRAFILTMLQHLTKAQATPTAEDVNEESETATPLVGDVAPLTAETAVAPAATEPEILPDLVLAIEEPELYQHPNRQRHFSRILLQLSRGVTPGVAKRTQVIYATHSPLFVDIDRFNQIRLLHKESNGSGKPKTTRVVNTTLATVAKLVWHGDGGTGPVHTPEYFSQRLVALMTARINEGFFAKAVVLVEGDDDVAAIVGVATARGVDLEALGIAVIPVCGKRNLDRPALIFREFGIPSYLVWDGDADKATITGYCSECHKPLEGKHDPAENRRLLRILEVGDEDWPCAITPKYCCFKHDLETSMKEELGAPLFDELLEACKAEFCMTKRKYAIKNPKVITAIIERAKARGKESATLNAIVDHIVRLVNTVSEKQSAAKG